MRQTPRPSIDGPLDPAHYREVFDGVQDIIYVRDMTGVLLEMNEAGARFFGRPREQLIGGTLHRHSEDEPARSLRATNELLFVHGVDRSTVEMQNGAGEMRILEATTTLMRDEDGHPIGAYGVMRDVTESIHLQQSLAETNETLLRLTGTLTLEKEKSERALAEAERQREIAEKAQALVAADHARKTQELEEARLLQMSLLPKQLPRLPHVDLAVHMSTATEVGGDYYDFCAGEDGALTVALGDATGHGMRAGILVATAKSYFQTLSRRGSLQEVLEAMSGAFRNLGNPSLYMCLLLMRIESRQALIVSAGMPSFLIHRPSSGVERIEVAGMPLGARSKPSFDGRVVDFDPETTLLFFSDGLPDLVDESERELGYERIERVFASCAGQSPERIVDRLRALAVEWTGNRPPADDITVLALRSV